MKNETAIWATKIGKPEWAEDLIYGGGKLLTEKQIEDCKAWCKANGFDRIRIKTMNMAQVPNFAATVNH